ncbi:UDP-4-amino-4,6-dideoxy-N-acetyl-beta-L-altrosamine transaminase [Colwellia sp. E2M01]|uniref:UDP-4-amino-4, 6-dideoxy-N-acetyl-beta-L-altrosamine transaminase n=1 Tax=Colwellia sp. E2M01 TaxID=2841561 RepID=UPI001C083422|nr:UDP-4-amino-4,6-dideoxy-N-acetyl-beta-L-altrosamine transaminase [Colwellia sp. E2M01]MBU2869961.1 UDP-4-amino-4,6-dideoxy-N-acetyl-beta-L-altrosamine transaminase [Colwellia sp. E2M01]
MIPYGKQDLNEDDIAAIVDVLKSDYLTQGPKVPEFEQAIASYCGAQFATATNSATSALHIACLALGVGQEDIVWTSPISFVASSNCALYCGANVDFVDIDIQSGNLSLLALTNKLHHAKLNNILPKALIVVHLAGNCCEMSAIYQLSLQYGFSIIEDASHAIGASYNSHKVGSCRYSDITIFSFHPVKIITSAEGGMALTNEAELAEKIQLLRNHGITNDPKVMTETSHGPWYYQQIELGFNYRMTELQAALGLSQAKRLDDFVQQRNALAQRYDQAFKNSSLTYLRPNSETHSSYHLYIVLLAQPYQDFHKEVISKLRAKNVFAHVHYIPIHLQPYYQNLGFKAGDYPIAENYYQRAISLPLYPNLSNEAQQYIIDTLLAEIQTIEKNLISVEN